VLGLGPDKEIHAVPTYQYSCTECGSALEAQQSFSDDPLTVCPECGGQLRKVFSAVGVVFKGSGFYRNDSRAGKNGDSASTSSSDSDKSTSSTSSSESGKGDSSSSSKSSGSSTKETANAGTSA
jgi:putative FmdB family regulatory protein